MGYDQLVFRMIQRFDQLNGRFDSFSPNDPGGLQEHDVRRFQPDRMPESADSSFIGCGRIFKIHYIRDQRSGNSSSPAQIIPGPGIDDNVFDIRQPGRKRPVNIDFTPV